MIQSLTHAAKRWHNGDSFVFYTGTDHTGEEHTYGPFLAKAGESYTDKAALARITSIIEHDLAVKEIRQWVADQADRLPTLKYATLQQYRRLLPEFELECETEKVFQAYRTLLDEAALTTWAKVKRTVRSWVA